MVCSFGSVCVQVASHGQLLRWKWASTDSGPNEQFYQSFEKIVTLSRDHQATQWLADISAMPPVGIDEQQWLSESWIMQFVLLGVKKVAVIEPSSLHNQLAIESVLADGRRYVQADVQYFPDTESALDWLTWSDTQAIQELEQEWQGACLSRQ
jgi:hypothetical protein